MNRKIGIGLIVTSLLYMLLFSTVPIGYATATDIPPAVEESESIDDVDNGINSEDIESSENVESAEVKENTESIESSLDEDNFESQESEETEVDGESVESQESKEDNLADIDNQQNIITDSLKQSKLINISILENTKLSAEMQNFQGNINLSLKFTGNQAVGVSIGNGININFILPKEIDVDMLDTTTVEVKYKEYYELLGLIPLGSRIITYNPEKIKFNSELNSIELNFKDVISIDLLGFNDQEYELNISLSKLPTSSDGKLKFGAFGSNGSLINLDFLQDAKYVDTIDVPTPPQPPKLLTIYSNTTVIRGKLPKDFKTNSAVTVDIGNGEEHLADVDINNGEFSLKLDQTLSAGTTVGAAITTADGLTSLESTKDVQSAPTPMTIVSGPLDFGTVAIGSDVPIKFLEDPLEIKIHDTRGINDNWELQARLENGPLKSESGHTLPNALGFNTDGQFKPFTKDAINIAKGEIENFDPIPLEWNPEEKQGPAIKIDHSVVYAESYSTDVTWTLVNSVQ